MFNSMLRTHAAITMFVTVYFFRNNFGQNSTGSEGDNAHLDRKLSTSFWFIRPDIIIVIAR